MSSDNESPMDDNHSSKKRKFDEAVEDQAVCSSPQIAKIAKATEINTPSLLRSNPVLQFQNTSLHPYSLRHGITLDSMTLVRSQFSLLTKKNREIKAQMQQMRRAVVEELLSHMKVRQTAIEHLGRQTILDDMRKLCTRVLENRKLAMVYKESELVCLEKLLGGHDAVLEHANAACLELDERIGAFLEQAAMGGNPNAVMTDLPRMSRLARLTGGEGCGNLVNIETETKSTAYTEKQYSFTVFTKLPIEIRLQIWEFALPGPRILTESSRHNKLFTMLGVCQESRKLVQSRLSRVLTPSRVFPLTPTPILYTNLEIDTVIRDLTVRDIDDQLLFNLEGGSFNKQCHQMLSGLSNVRHLALAYDLLRENGGTLFGSIQACCPHLKTLTVFPSSQLTRTPRALHHHLKFIDLDSNLMDYVSLRWDRLSERKTKLKARRGLEVLTTLSSHAMQYKTVFPEYVEVCGQEWKPAIKVCFIARWNRHCQGWQTRPLDGDRYSRGFPGDDGKLHKGFIESGMVCGSDGELFSRYDGLKRIFEDHESISTCTNFN